MIRDAGCIENSPPLDGRLRKVRVHITSLFLGRRRRTLLGSRLRRSNNKGRRTFLVAMRLRRLVSRRRFLRKEFKMHVNPPAEANAIETLSKAELAMLQEINRQAELYLDSQLTAALASDQRATAFVTALSGAIAVVLGAAATLVVADAKYQLLVLPLVPLAVFLLAALWSTTQSCKPDDFEYSGNCPRNWLEDICDNKSMELCLAEQAIHYADMIASNDKVLSRCADDMRSALKLLFGGLICASAALVFALFGIVTHH